MESQSKGQRIGEILLDHGILSREELNKALETQKAKGGLIGAILVNSGFVKEEDLAFALAKQFNYPFLSLDNVTVNRNLMKEFGREFLLENCFVPIEKTRDVLTVALADPSDDETIKKIQSKTNLSILAFVGGVKQIEEMIRRVFGGTKESDSIKTDSILKKAAEDKMKDKK
ncbi:MAG: hypothetical protein HZC17_06180 [Candidatus Omnitrophica bacterium]|nr:hypothetical protein [Candidatus Omnitrophota bacterium]